MSPRRAPHPRAAVLLVSAALAACAASPAAPPRAAPPSAAPEGLGRPARVERAHFHGPSDPALDALLRALLEHRLAGAEGAGAPAIGVELQLVRVELGRRLRAAALPATVATLGLSAWLGDAHWRVESRLSGRLRVRSAAGCRLAEVQDHLDYARRCGLRDPTPLPHAAEMGALVDRLIARARRRLDVRDASAGAPACIGPAARVAS